MHLVKSFWGWDQLSQSWSAVLKAQLSRRYFSVIFGAQQVIVFQQALFGMQFLVDRLPSVYYMGNFVFPSILWDPDAWWIR